MKVKRFEFGGTGIFHALDVLENCEMERADEEELYDAERELEEFLPIPDAISAEYNRGVKMIFFFKQKGLEKFKEPLESLVFLFKQFPENDGLGELNEIELELPEDIIYYQDEYQAVAKVEDLVARGLYPFNM